jgi:uncharacterized protein
MAPFMKKQRYCRSFDGVTYFKPRGIPLRELKINEVALDELEAIHLCDHDGLNQAEAAKKMKISSSTLQRLLYSGRKKIIDALYTSKAIKLSQTDQILEYVDAGKRCRRGQRGMGKCVTKTEKER